MEQDKEYELAELKILNAIALSKKVDRLCRLETPLNKWHRLIQRNSWTIEPAKPLPEPSDIAAERAAAKYKKLPKWVRIEAARRLSYGA